MKKKKSFLSVATEAATEVGEILLKDFDKTKILKYKDRQDIVTNIDIKAETLIISKIKENFPDHNIFSEEKGRENLNSKYTWVIDPLDGTKHYLRKMPIFCTSIALQKDGEVILGVVYAPMLKSFFYAEKGKGAYLNKKRIKVSETKSLKDAFIYMELPNYKLSEKEAKENNKKLAKFFEETYRIRVWGGGPLGMCYVACGSFDAYLLLGTDTNFWDIAAASIIVTEAGGKITDSNNKKFTEKTGKPVVSNGKIHNQILKILKK